MNDELSDDGLQFEDAEFAEGPTPEATQCGICGQVIEHQYFQVNDRVVCGPCRDQLGQALQGGSSSVRFLRAFVAGGAAAAVGAGLYYAILALTGYEIGLVAIVVGLMVGAAVRWGCNGRGGWAYQTLAIVLTYSSIVVTYLPFVFDGIEEANEETEAGNGGAVEEEELGSLEILIALALLLVLAWMAPVLAGFGNIIGLLIIGFALFEAWKLNKRPEFEIRGPLALGHSRGAPGDG